MKIVFAALVALLVTAGCARADDSTAGSPAQAPPAASDLPSSTPTASGEQTVTGKVSAGVEAGCLVLTGPGVSYLLLFDDPSLKATAAAGADVVVTGKADPSRMTTCQQGTPFLVTAIRQA